MPRSDVLIVGAGPTGLVLALWLTKLGVNLRIIDKTSVPGTTSRALAVHARTLELYRQLDLADFIVEHGHKVPAVRLWVEGQDRETDKEWDKAVEVYRALFHSFPDNIDYGLRLANAQNSADKPKDALSTVKSCAGTLWREWLDQDAAADCWRELLSTY